LNASYDAIYELLSATQGGTTTKSYTFDPVGNRTASLGVSSYTTNSSNELTAITGASFTYDYNGNTGSKTVSSSTTNYSWDYENRLTSVTLPGSGGTVSFVYDPFGRRIKKVSSTGTSVFAYDGDNLIEETNSSGTVVARYSQALNIDEPLALLRSSATSYFNADGLGSITSLANASGALVQTYTFDSFGKQTASSGSVTNALQYTSREYDAETGLYFYRARYYDSSTGHFLSEDPIGFEASTNFYPYVGNNPTNQYDPLGRDAQDVGIIISRAGEWTNALVLGGLRRPGTGHKSGNWNNIHAFGQMLIMGLQYPPHMSLIPYFGCGQQTDYVLYGLSGLLNNLHDNWTFSKEEGFLNLSNGDPFWHQRIRASSPNPNDPDLIVDPWLNQYQAVPKGGNPTQQGWKPLK
jgi:RHS repeat-associated protein